MMREAKQNEMPPPVEGYTDCRFMPLRILEKAIQPVLTPNPRISEGIAQCKQNIVKLQRTKIKRRSINAYSWNSLYGYAIRKAVYKHDWDQLLLLLRASPVWEHELCGKYQSYSNVDIYYRAYIILLTHHPEAKSQNLLHEYLHMVHSCRSDEDKKGMIKILSTLTDKIISRNSHPFASGDILKEDIAKDKILSEPWKK